MMNKTAPSSLDYAPPTLPLWRQRLNRLRHVVRLRQFDVSPPEGRSAERHRRIALSGLAAMVAKAVSVIVMFVTVRLTANYLGNERYGMWMTISSLTLLFGFADLGLGNGLLNAISDADGRGDRDAAASHVSSGFYMLSGFAALLGLVFTLCYPFVPWPRVFNVTSDLAVREAGPAMAMMAGCFLLSVPLMIVSRVQLGYQEGFAASLWTAAGSLVSLAALLIAVEYGAGLPWLVAALAGAPLLVTFVNGVVVFGWQRPYLLPRPALFTLEGGKRLIRIGLLYLVLQVIISMAFTADNIVAAQVLGAESVAQYSVPMRLFSVPITFVMMVLSPLWPAYGEAQARRDLPWIRRTLRRSILLAAAVSVPAALLLALAHRPLIRLWVGPQIQPTFWLIFGIAAWTVIGSIGNALAMFLNGLHVFRFQVIIGFAMAIANLALSIALARTIGLPGVIWGTVISYGLLSIVPCWIYIPRMLARLAKDPAQWKVL